jgi:hypothetical protein
MSASRYPIVVSFYSSTGYYRAAADALMTDCDRCGLDHDIVELNAVPGENWIDICRRKIPFYRQMQLKHRRPILWLDVDTRIGRVPEELADASFDMAGFLRGIRYLRDFDTGSQPRFFAPFALFFNNTPAASAFLDQLASLESDSPTTGTDDYFLQEAWRTHGQELSVLVLPPRLVGRQWPLTDQQALYVGISGNVRRFKARAAQHEVPVLQPLRRKAVLLHEAGSALKEGQDTQAMMLFKCAYAAVSNDDALAMRIARLLRRQGRPDEALAFLREHQRGGTSHDLAGRFQFDSALISGRFDEARRLVQGLTRGTEADRLWAISSTLRLDIEECAAASATDPLNRMSIFCSDCRPGIEETLLAYMVLHLSGIAPKLVSAPASGALGSAASAVPGSLVWGAGLPRESTVVEPDARYCAVRGPLTRAALLDAGVHCPDRYGTLASVLPLIYAPRRSGQRHAVALVTGPGSTDVAWHSLGVKLLDSQRPGLRGLEKFIDDLCSCDMILSTTLVGLMIADAYGIPSRWCRVQSSRDTDEDDFQFHDYFLSCGTEPPEPMVFDLPSMLGSTSDLSTHAEAPRRLPHVAKFLDTAPFGVLPRWKSTANERVLGAR